AIPDVCADHGLLTLAGGAPSNGTYTGPFVSSGTFDVDAAGVGTHDVLYIYQDTSTQCVDSALQTITVHPNPLVTIISDDTICLGDTVLLTGTGATAYAWSDGSALPTTAVSPATSAWFSVTGTDGNGCTGTDQAFILVYSLPALSVSNDTSICEGECAILTAYGAGDFSWSDGTAAASAQVCPVTTKSYIVTLTDTNGCSSTRDVEVTVYPLPPSPVSNGDKEVCFGYPNPVLEVSGNNVIWYSDPAGTQQVAVGNAYLPLQLLPGTYPYWASSTSPQGCEGPLTQVTLIIHALPAPPIGGPDRGVCLGLQNPLLSATGNAIRWYADPVLGTLLANGSTYRPAVSSTGTYKFYVTQTDPVTGCQSLPDSIILSIFELPLVNAGPDLSYIIGGDSVLTGSVVGTFPLTLAWTPVHHLGSPASAHTSVNTPVSEVCTLRVTDGNGCINTDHASVNVLPDGNSLAGRVYYDNKILQPLPYSSVIRTGLTVKDSDTAQVDAFGYYSFKKIPAGSSSFTARTGNLWGWGGVNTTDALLVARHFVKLDTLKGLSLDAADVNQDQTENTTDAVLIARRFAGLVSSFAAGDWTFMDSTFTFDSADFHVFNIGA
ncbi:MAG: hypothetical protein IH599_02330, partial [Bacteroidales bacterium]|nr:hypothetical protein [Bacteroidales bacterium]